MVFLSPKSLSLLMDPPFYDVFFASELRLERREFRPRYFSPFACLSHPSSLLLFFERRPPKTLRSSPPLFARESLQQWRYVESMRVLSCRSQRQQSGRSGGGGGGSRRLLWTSFFSSLIKMSPKSSRPAPSLLRLSHLLCSDLPSARALRLRALRLRARVSSALSDANWMDSSKGEETASRINGATSTAATAAAAAVDGRSLVLITAFRLFLSRSWPFRRSLLRYSERGDASSLPQNGVFPHSLVQPRVRPASSLCC